MKRNILNICLAGLAAIAVTVACDKDGEATGFTISADDITIDAQGGEEVLEIVSSSEWVALADEPWMSISPANGIGSAKCHIRIDSTLLSGVREGQVRFAPVGGEAKLVKIHQVGYGKVISPEKESVEIANSAAYDSRYFEVKVTANVGFDVQIDGVAAQWLSVADYTLDLDRGSRPRTVKLKFNWKMNPLPEERTATVKFVPSSSSDEVTVTPLTVTQNAAPKIEDNRAGDSLALITIADKLQASGWDTGESMMHWNEVELWADGDEGLPSQEAVGRVKYVRFFVFSTKESIPMEVKYLKYAETISFYGNTNTMYLNIDLGSDICSLKYLKNLQVAAYGLTSLPDELAQMKQLEVLDLTSNNFSSIPSVLTPENFPNMKELGLGGMRRWLITDLRNKDNSRYQSGMGLLLDTDKEDDAAQLKKLFMWDNLEYLALTYNYLEGGIPDFEIGKDGVTGYTEEDAVRMGLQDTIKFLYDPSVEVEGAPKGTTIPKILPNIKSLRLNLNFMTGKIPDWILYHPHFMDWIPDTFIFSQQDRGINSKGEVVGFSNVPKDFEYYYSAFPKYRAKYYIAEESE